MRRNSTTTPPAASSTAPAGKPPSVAEYVLGNLLIATGAFFGAFGTIAWLAEARAPSVAVALLGAVVLGAIPLLVGLGILWAGFSVLEGEEPPAWRVSDAQFVEAAREGATVAAVALRVGARSTREAETRLDALVVREALDLDVTEEGELLYRAR
jgi:hypothetical protein